MLCPNVFFNEISFSSGAFEQVAGRARTHLHFVELAGQAGLNLSGRRVDLFYRESGVPFYSLILEGTLPNQVAGHGARAFVPSRAALHHPFSGAKLFDRHGRLCETLHLERLMRSRVESGQNGTALAMEGTSLQRTSRGTDMIWTWTHESQGLLNINQTFPTASLKMGDADFVLFAHPPLKRPKPAPLTEARRLCSCARMVHDSAPGRMGGNRLLRLDQIGGPQNMREERCRCTDDESFPDPKRAVKGASHLTSYHINSAVESSDGGDTTRRLSQSVTGQARAHDNATVASSDLHGVARVLDRAIASRQAKKEAKAGNKKKVKPRAATDGGTKRSSHLGGRREQSLGRSHAPAPSSAADASSESSPRFPKMRQWYERTVQKRRQAERERMQAAATKRKKKRAEGGRSSPQRLPGNATLGARRKEKSKLDE